jgi:hypothetical protein
MFKVALVGPELEENLSLRYLASSLTVAGFSSQIVPFDGPDDLQRVLAALLESGEPPALIGLSLSFQRRAKDFLALSLALRQNGYTGHITAGGHFGTFACTEILRDFPEIDSICRHEAENTLVSLAKALCSGSDLAPIPGLACRDAHGNVLLTELPAPPDLQRLPWPDRRGVPSECLGHRLAPLVASRGCYGHCAFCCISAWHEQTLPGKRFRLRPIEDVADEMGQLYHQRKIEVFIFHDDNFFLPDRSETLRRIGSLADILEQRGVWDFATIVKARPNDLTPDVLSAMRERLGLIRLYVGIENASDLGLSTLRRRVRSDQNHYALELLEHSGVFSCFNLLIFDPTTRIEDLEINLAFMEKFAAVPQNFGRVELYAGTPLLARLQAEGRCKGDYLDWDYRIADDAVQKIFELAMKCFYVRNFSDEAAPHRLMGARFAVEMAARFHPWVFRESWRTEARRLNCTLSHDSVKAMREIIEFVGSGGGRRDEMEFTATLAGRLRAVERMIHDAADLLEKEIENAIGKTAQYNPEYWVSGGNPHEKEQGTKPTKRARV